MSYTMTRNAEAPPLQRWSVEQEDRFKKHLLRLPTDDYLNAKAVEMIRCTASKFDRSTGEVGAAVHIECHRSWFTVKFDEVDEARGFARCLADLRDELNDR